ncbi:ras-related protein Rab-10 isoform X1 [Caretta caretta]|uniref:ras-related protein Rab-10 isoform X1 n=1 Tax=Caretta caretta TaxID=8467 RepID=UPI002095F865|nr:ras-related protein Rab-10-like isoform X1 [Caretta caretta]
MAGPGHRSAGKPLLVKIVMAGESCVGKTSIVRRYTEPSPAGPPPAASYIATVGIDFKVKTITFNDTTVKLQIWDTAGQEQFHTISTSYFRGAHGFVLVYDITNSDSFQGITSWMKDIHEKADDEVDIVLLGNKCDKETERVIPKHNGEKDFLLLRWKELRFSLFLPSMDQLSAALLLCATPPFGERLPWQLELAWEYGVPFFETSATDNINIEDAFSVLVKEIMNKNSYVLCDLDVVDLNESKKKRTCCQL